MTPSSSVLLFRVLTEFGGGAYYPVSLLSVGMHLQKALPDRAVSVVDLHHYADWNPAATIVRMSQGCLCTPQPLPHLPRQRNQENRKFHLGGGQEAIENARKGSTNEEA